MIIDYNCLFIFKYAPHSMRFMKIPPITVIFNANFNDLRHFEVYKNRKKNRNIKKTKSDIMVKFFLNSLFFFIVTDLASSIVCVFIDCPNCVDESQYTPNKWTMPLLKLGEKRYYLGIFFKVSHIPLAIYRYGNCNCNRSAICDESLRSNALGSGLRLHKLHMVFYT